jgi:hypothetical protein
MPPKCVLMVLCLSVVCIPAAFAGVTVTSPANGATLQGPVLYVASATTSCSKGVGSMGIYTAPGVLAYVVNGSSMNTTLNLNPGTYNSVVEEWDNCGGAGTTPITITVTGGSKSGVFVTSPANNSTVTSPANFVATATTTCSKGVSSMGIYTAPGQLAYVVNGAGLNYALPLNPGTYNTVVQECDDSRNHYCNWQRQVVFEFAGQRRMGKLRSRSSEFYRLLALRRRGDLVHVPRNQTALHVRGCDPVQHRRNWSLLGRIV